MWRRRKRTREQSTTIVSTSPSYWSAGDQPAPGEHQTYTAARITVNGAQVDPNTPEGQEALRLARDLVEHGSGGAPAPTDQRYADLERIAKLHAEGALTDEEFAAEKRRILGSI